MPVRLSLLSLFACCCVAHAADLTPQQEIAAKAPAALTILKAWETDNPEPAGRMLRVILWTPVDRDPAPDFRRRLSGALLDIRDFYAREMARLGFGPRAPRLDLAADGLLRITLVRGRAPYADYDVSSGHRIREECLPVLRAAGIDPDSETLVIFCNMANWDADKRVITQNSPYYAGGTHLSGNAWQVDSPILDRKLLDNKEPRVRDGQYGDISVGRYNSIFIGGACHEIGHALGLPHARERADERAAFGTALMGSGNRTYGEELRGEGKGSFLTFAHGLRLASHPLFSGSFKGANLPANARPSQLSIQPDENGFLFSGTVEGHPPVYGVVAYLDPEGGGDYDATTATAIPAADGSFTLRCRSLAPGKAGELRVVFLQANGAASAYIGSSPFRFPYRVLADGTVDVTDTRIRLALQPLADAIQTGDRPAAARELKAPAIQRDARLKEIATRLAATMDRSPFAEPGEDLASLPLSDLKPLSQRVGWGRPVSDRLPEPPVMLASGGKVFAHGLYAHAPASHVWQLDGAWKSLDTRTGLAEGKGGSVRFRILTDDREAAVSPVIREGGGHHFQVDLTGVQKLELQVDDAGDGNSSDWGLWLEPTLQR